MWVGYRSRYGGNNDSFRLTFIPVCTSGASLLSLLSFPEKSQGATMGQPYEVSILLCADNLFFGTCDWTRITDNHTSPKVMASLYKTYEESTL